MSGNLYLGIDAGGTHTDAALILGDGPEKTLLARAKVETRHDDLTASVREALAGLGGEIGAGSADVFARIGSVTLGATLAVNALVQGKTDAVGLALSAGPGLNPLRFAIGGHVCVVPGGLDHRGLEIRPLETRELVSAAIGWKKQGLSACACAGKFSPRNPAHERAMSRAAVEHGFSITQGHRLSGGLNFPRRIATAYYNAAVERLHLAFLDAVEKALASAGIRAPSFLLKADGGAVPLSLSRRCPVQSILSGPAASVMGILALCPSVARGCSLLLDMGGTTTDIALVVDGSPVTDRDGMLLNGRRTLVRSLAAVSVGVGGDSLLTTDKAGVHAGPLREGPAMAFGGGRPTLLDALNFLNAQHGGPVAGNTAASQRGIAALAAGGPDFTGRAAELAEAAVEDGLKRIRQAAGALVARVNSRPVYTLAALKAARGAAPERIALVGGPAACVRGRLENSFRLPAESPAHADVANAVGAALTLPTASLEIYADTGQGILRAPALDLEERIGRSFTLEAARLRCRDLLSAHLAEEGVPDAPVEVLEADLFATLSDSGHGARDIRVVCQAVPGLAGRLRP
ncbi:MAG: hydantoinase/oxoprolinase family protein [Desulfovibrio sp.]|jgi:N-methylhydantoinase A/oxoprolinase/acetone carboxylase beta subunit|nr:hydantoinase/oxoprolinase family protein [Desulfovibrio sp.]